MNETDTLRGLINMARRDRDKSIRQLAFEAQAAGHKIVGTTLSAIESGTYKSAPSSETIRAIGWLAGVSDEVSFAAAGKRVPGPPFAAELPPGVDELEDDERKAAITVLRTLVALRREINRDQDATDSTTQQGASSQAGKDQKTDELERRRKDQAATGEDQGSGVDRSAEWGKPQPLPDDVEGEIAAGRMAASRRPKPADLEDESVQDAEDLLNAAARAAAKRLGNPGKGDVEA